MTTPSSLFATLLLGFILGLRHALDIDHIVAVSTLVAREKNFWRSTRIGAIWGLGHTATLLVMGLLIIVLGLHISEGLAFWLQMAVAAMLIFLGAKTLWDIKTGRGHFCTHHHQDGATHTHFHRHGEHACAKSLSHHKPNEADNKQQTQRPTAANLQSFWVGMIHGLSGSAELMLLILATIRYPAWALAYIASFGAGMIVAMFAITSVLSCVFGWAGRQNQVLWMRIDRGLRALTGTTSLSFGCYLVWVVL